MKRLLFILTIFVAIAAQAQDTPNIDEMHLRKWKYITDRCKLNAQESEQVKALFLEYEQSQWRLMEEFRKTMKEMNDRKKDDKSFDYEKFNEIIVNNDFKRARILRTYYQKLKLTISAEKIFCFFDAEQKYRHELIKDFRRKDSEQKNSNQKN
ncbi:MAG: hypothetical protein LBV75_04105 [Paludibacter sp.]|nr:hypothetical protein [Paludibacter sp.]